MNTVHRPSDLYVNWSPHVQGQSTPVQVNEPYIGNLKRLLVGLSGKNTGVYNVRHVHLPKMSVMVHGSI